MTKILMLILAVLFLQATSISLTKHDGFTDTCFYLPVGNAFTTRYFNYTITQAWTSEQAPQLKSGALNTSDFIDVQGWVPYKTPNRFFAQIGRKGINAIRELTYVKDVVEGSDAPEFGLSTPDLQFAFGYPSQAKLYKVPSGKALITLRFQAAVTSNPYLGRWSVITELVDIDELELRLKVEARRVQREIKSTHLTPREVTSVLNIIPSFIENSLFWTFSSSPAQGTNEPVNYQGFVVAIREGESVLAGPIYNGQPGVIQVKDVVRNRGSCE